MPDAMTAIGWIALSMPSLERPMTIERLTCKQATEVYAKNWMKNLWFRMPMQLPTQGQWWSILITHRLQTEQWWVLGGFTTMHFWQNLYSKKLISS
jgi:hypothetical protein